MVIPNAELFTGSVVVNTAFDNRRTEYNVGIGYSDDSEEAKRLILAVMQNTEGVLENPPPDVLLVSLGSSTVDLRARWWSKPERGEILQVQDLVITAIQKTLSENGIDIPFPTQQILFHDQTEETDGDRTRQREGWPAGKKKTPRSRWAIAQANLPNEAAALADSHGDGHRP